MLVLTKLVDSLEDHQGLLFKIGVMSALLSSAGNVPVFINSLKKHIGSASSLAASRKAHEGMVEGLNSLNFPRARSALT